MNNRRKLLVALSAGALAWAGNERVQSQGPILIGVLNAGSREPNLVLLAAFKQALAALGRTEGSDVVFDERWAEGRMDRLSALGRDLASKAPALIVAGSVSAAVAAAETAPTIPIVYVGGDPLAAGLAKSLAHPGGMVTGVSNFGTFVSVKFYLEMQDAIRGDQYAAARTTVEGARPTTQVVDMDRAAAEIRRGQGHLGEDPDAVR